MNSRIFKAIVKKDLMDIYRSKNLLATLIIIPILFSIILPATLLAGALFFDLDKLTGADARHLVDSFVTQLNNGGINFESLEQQFVYLFINYLLPSLFLLVPIITASTVAANSFVGEKERRTLESLLFSPITIKTLFISKVAASFIPSFLVSIVSFILSGLLINSMGYPLFGSLIFPSANWLALVFCLSPMVSFMTVLLNIYISSRVKTYQEAQNISGVIVLPVIALLVGQASGLFLVGTGLTLIISFVILIINIALLQRMTKYNDRFLLFEKQI
ncbi:ABC transporter permease subunit [Niallia sp. Krafla_26]|uniref:ABC transporter permease subunit n=1 Tax=Niallia sp. Krafla_26 TaxID=3064703 RepID=UPI003D1837EB